MVLLLDDLVTPDDEMPRDYVVDDDRDEPWSGRDILMGALVGGGVMGLLWFLAYVRYGV